MKTRLNRSRVARVGFFRPKYVLVLAVAVVVGFIASLIGGLTAREITRDEYDAWFGLTRHEGATYSLRSPMTGFNVIEIGVDEDADGENEEHAVFVNGEQSLGGKFDSHDTDDDGYDEYRAFAIGKALREEDVRPWLKIEAWDNNDDRQFDLATISLRNASDVHQSFQYEDLDKDGRIDLVRKFHNDQELEVQVLIEDEWITTSREIDEEGKVFEAAVRDGVTQKVRFADGKWRVTEGK